MSKHIELAKKLKALADRGVGGEKHNAADMLEKLMKKHRITWDDLEMEARRDYEFLVQKKAEKLFVQIVGTVMGVNFDLYFAKDNPRCMIIEMTAAEAVEIQGKFDFYWRYYQEELETFYIAFLKANKLFPKNGPRKKTSELTPEELEQRLKADRMALGIEAKSYFKQLDK